MATPLAGLLFLLVFCASLARAEDATDSDRVRSLIGYLDDANPQIRVRAAAALRAMGPAALEELRQASAGENARIAWRAKELASQIEGDRAGGPPPANPGEPSGEQAAVKEARVQAGELARSFQESCRLAAVSTSRAKILMRRREMWVSFDDARTFAFRGHDVELVGIRSLDPLFKNWEVDFWIADRVVTLAWIQDGSILPRPPEAIRRERPAPSPQAFRAATRLALVSRNRVKVALDDGREIWLSPGAGEDSFELSGFRIDVVGIRPADALEREWEVDFKVAGSLVTLRSYEDD